MTQDEKAILVRLMCGEQEVTDITDEDISAYLLVAGEAILRRRYPYGVPEDVNGVPSQYDRLHCEEATFLIAKRGAEGQTVHAENGIDRSYENGYIPSSMLKSVVPYCGVF